MDDKDDKIARYNNKYSCLRYLDDKMAIDTALDIIIKEWGEYDTRNFFTFIKSKYKDTQTFKKETPLLLQSMLDYWQRIAVLKSTKHNKSMLLEYLKAGLSLTPWGLNKDGRPFQFLESDAQGHYIKGKIVKIKTEAELDKWLNSNNIARFIFYPADNNFLCIDIDDHEDNGFMHFNDFLINEKIPAKTFDTPTFTLTPHGKHLYFRTDKPCNACYKKELTTGVEIKGGGKYTDKDGKQHYGINLTAGGTCRDGTTLYTLHGNLATAPLLSNTIIDKYFIKQAPPKPIYTPRNYNTGKVDIDNLVYKYGAKPKNAILKDHDFLWGLGVALKSNNISRDEVENILYNHPRHLQRNKKYDTDYIIKSLYDK